MKYGLLARRAMAANSCDSLAKPRGGRRLGTQSRPSTSLTSPSQSFPPPSWGSNSPDTSAGSQQLSGGFNFGQNQSTSLPPFGGNNSTGVSQQFPAPSGSGFSFSPSQGQPTNNPFSSQPQNAGSGAQSGGFQGSIFNIAPSNTGSNALTSSVSTSNPSEEAKEQDSQPLFAAHAPFKWGQPETPTKPQLQLPTAQPATNPFKLTNSQSSGTPFGPSEQLSKQPNDTGIFGQNQQSGQSISGFGQSNQQQPQASNSAFGQVNGQPSSSQSKPSSSSVFGHLGSQPGLSANNIFSKPAAQTNSDADSMSISPDTSPQSIKQAKGGPFAFLNTPPVQNQPTRESGQGPKGGLFASLSQASSDQNPVSSVTGHDRSETSPSKTIKTNGIHPQPSSVSPGLAESQSKKPDDTSGNQNLAESNLNLPHQHNDTPAVSNIFGNPKAVSTTQAAPGLFDSSQSFQPSVDTHHKKDAAEQNGAAGSATTHQQEIANMPTSKAARRPGEPPSPPADFSLEQRHQLITGYRLKCLDVGFQHYIANSPNFHNESEAITNFYLKRKREIFDADGGLLDEDSGHRTKKPRFEPSSSTTGVTEKLANGILSHSGSPAKRKADDDAQSGNASYNDTGAKRTRIEGQVSYPQIPSASSNSNTSNVFKNILGNRSTGPLMDNNNNNNNNNNNDTASGPSPFKTSSKQSSPTKHVSPAKPNNVSSDPFSQSIKGHGPQSQPLSSTNSTLTAGHSNVFSKPAANAFTPVASSAATSSTPKAISNESTGSAKAPNFKLPAFNNTGSVNFLAQFGQAAEAEAKKEKAKRKAEDQESDEDDAEWDLRDAEAQRAKRQRLEEIGRNSQKFTLTDSDKENRASTQPPRATQSGSSIFSKPQISQNASHNIFAHLSDADSGAEGSKTGDADDEETGSEGEDEANVAVGKADTAQVNKPSGLFIQNNVFGSPSVTTSTTPTASPNKEENQAQTSGRSLFDRITKDSRGDPIREEQPTDQGKGGSLFKFSQPQNSTSLQQTGGSLFAQQPLSAGSSLFSKDSSTGSTKPAGATATSSNSAISGLQSSSSQVPPTAGIFGNSVSPSNNTWKPDSPIRFGSQGNPAVNITSPSPTKPSHGGMFGASKPSIFPETSTKGSASLFSATTKPTPSLFGFASGGSLASQNSSLVPPFSNPSNATSRATSPGLTTGESANESATGEAEDEASKEEQIDLSKGGPGEDEEDVVFDVKAKALILEAKKEPPHAKEWNTRAIGQCRVMKHRETGKARILMRQEAIGRIVLNVGLLNSLEYVVQDKNHVKVPVPVDTGKIESWMIRVKKPEDAASMARILEENKSN